jgi:hypothetical protein
MPIELPVGRKYPLMIRDDLAHKLEEKYKQWRKNCFDEILTKEMEQLTKDVRKKWNTGIYWPETTRQGVTDYWLPTTPAYAAVEDARVGGTLILNGEIIFASFKDNGLIKCPPHKIPIIIDPTILTHHDAQTIKEAVWNIVKAEIGKQNKTIQGRACAVPAEEPEELAVVLRCKPETFAKYLRWYDHKEAGLPFRLIALIEFHSKPEDRGQKFEEHIKRKKKPKIGKPVKGESTIREGFNKIYRAINRKSAPTQEDDIPTSGEYNCPEHGGSCDDPDCAYLKRWLADFNKKNKMLYLEERLFSHTGDIDRIENPGIYI